MHMMYLHMQLFVSHLSYIVKKKSYVDTEQHVQVLASKNDGVHAIDHVHCATF